MVSVITSNGMPLRTFNTGSGTTANDEVGGDAMASIDKGVTDTHDRDSSDASTMVSFGGGVGIAESHTLIRFVIPTEDEMIGRILNIDGSGQYPRLTKIPESGLTLEGASIFLAPTSNVTLSLHVYELTEDFSENDVTYESPAGNTGDDEWDADFAASTKIYKNNIGFNNWTGASDLKEFKLDGLIKVNKYNWGDKLLLYLKANQGASDFFLHSPNSSTSAKRPVVKIRFSCDPPIPKITVTPDTNGIDGIINITTPSGDSFLADGKYHAAWNTSSTITYNQSSKSTSFTDTAITSLNTNQIAGALLDSDATDYYISMFAEDGISVDARSGQSNIVHIQRPECSAALTNAAGGSDYTPEVGEEMTLTITPANGMYSGKVKEFGVNWDSGTSDLDSDYSWYKLETASSSAYTIKHKFHKVDTFQIKVKVKDQDGWSSDATATATANTVVQEPTPIANLSLSKDKVLQSKYLDRTTVVTANLSKSKAIGSNRDLTNYLFRYTTGISSTICTSGAINNDNSAFDNLSSRVSLQVIDAGFDFSDTAFQVYGQASFNSSGDPIADNAPTFDHYKYVTEKLFCPATRLTEGSEKTSAAGAAGRGVSYYFYKTIEIVVCTAKDSEIDHQTRFILKKYSADDSDATIINSALYVGNIASDANYNKLYSWGNYARIQDTSAEYDGSSNYIDLDSVTAANNSDEDWMNNGFYIGDIIKVQESDNNNGTYANPKYFKIASFSQSGGSTYDRATIVTDSSLLNSHEKSYVSTSITNSTSATSDIVLDNSSNPTVTFAVYNTTGSDDTVTILGRVTDSDETSWVTNPSSEVSQTLRAIVPNTLDLDSLVDNGHIAILSSSINRAGGLSAQMPIGQRKYPIGVVRTKAGMPTLALSIRILSQTGLKRIISILDGDVYDYCFLDSDKVDSPTVAYKSYKLKADGGSLNQDPSAASQYLSDITFTIMGEELQVE